jgi:hypothetical protein
MTRTRIIRAVLVAAISFALGATAAPAAAQQPASGAVDAVSLLDAIDQGLVRAEFTGNGSASGAAMLLRVARTSPSDLTLMVPLGLLLLNGDAEEQDMVVRQLLGESRGGSSYRPLTLIELRDDDEHVFILEAYCLEATLDNPARGSGFTPAGLAGEDVIAVLEAVDRVPDADEEITVIQAAVWAITDDISRDELDEIGYGLDDDEAELAAAILREAGFDATAFRLFGG